MKNYLSNRHLLSLCFMTYVTSLSLLVKHIFLPDFVSIRVVFLFFIFTVFKNHHSKTNQSVPQPCHWVPSLSLFLVPVSPAHLPLPSCFQVSLFPPILLPDSAPPIQSHLASILSHHSQYKNQPFPSVEFPVGCISLVYFSGVYIFGLMTCFGGHFTVY